MILNTGLLKSLQACLVDHNFVSPAMGRRAKGRLLGVGPPAIAPLL
jgi:hypothetical protein